MNQIIKPKNFIKKALIIIALFLIGVIVLYLFTSNFGQGGVSNETEKQASSKNVVYTCPMHPQIIRSEPGKCPICNMDLVPKESVGTQAANHGDTSGLASSIMIDPVVVQNMGVRVVPAIRKNIFRTVRTIGQVDVAENEIATVNLKFSGWVEKLQVNQTGQYVKLGEKLFDIYSPEILTSQEEYLLALKTGGADSELTKSAKNRLLFYGVPDSVIAEVSSKRQVQRTLAITAPFSGYILQKNVIEGDKVEAGQELFRIGNLRKIWVTAEVYEFFAPLVEAGKKATMELTYQEGKEWQGKVAYVYPTLDEKSRTLKIRLEFENPGLRLKPGMFAVVKIQAEERNNTLVIPEDAVIHTGEKQIVFIAKELGKYEAREVETGITNDNGEVEIISGINDGELVVTSGQFLLDSESQIRSAIEKFSGEHLHGNILKTSAPKAEQKEENLSEVDKNHGGAKESGKVIWTCPMHPQIIRDHPGTCPICGMDLVKQEGK